MASIRSRTHAGAAVAVWLFAWPFSGDAQQQPTGFALERFYPSAPGAAWFVMDDLNVSGGLGGAFDLTSGYARAPLVIPGSENTQRFALVSNQAFVNVGAAVTYDRFRLYLNLPMPYLVTGSSGTFGSLQLNAPAVTPGTNPDTVADTQLGFDARLYGEPGSSVRLGASAQVIFPSGARNDYISDARYRAMFRFLTAGDSGSWSYAGQLGVHVRPLVDTLVPGGPNGSEFLFGASGGRKKRLNDRWGFVVGPEVFGQTAFRAFFTRATGVEGLMTARFERLGQGRNVRLKLGIGHGIVQHFGTPEWRVLFALELFGQLTRRGN
jgi:hypothetical protein